MPDGALLRWINGRENLRPLRSEKVDVTNPEDGLYLRSRKNSRNSFADSLSPTAEYTSGA